MAIRRAFVSGAGAKVLTILLGLAAIGAATRHLGANAYGVVAIIVGLTGLFGFLDFGIGGSLVSDLARSYARRTVRDMRTAVTNSYAALSVIGGLVVVLGCPIVLNLPSELLFDAPGVNATEIRLSLLLYVVATGVTLPFNVGPRIALSLQFGLLTGIVNLVSGVMVLVLVAIGVSFDLSLSYFVLIFVGVPGITNFAVTIYLFIRHKRYVLPKWSLLSFSGALNMVLRGLPFLVMGIAGAIAYQTDILVVAYVLGSAGAAVFAVLTRIFSSLIQLFAGGLQQMWASVAHALAEDDKEWVRRKFWHTFSITMTLFVVAAGLAVLLGPSLVPIWVGSSISPSWDLFLAFAVWNTYNFAMMQFSFLLNGAGKVWSQAIPALIMAGINVPLSIYLTQQIGLAGPLYGSLISHSLTVGWLTVLWALRVLRPADSQVRISSHA
ncbi:hypothetical protein [Cryobacterium sp. PH31-O1]|uniref:hypothetical protein n=1 Tax=Cryobacterium sp. PH31-O1 TaxID=3046306 RepID=UPI0024BA0247|nr:hypothetical protein [Cryobacterium sp. PH31-O1]MDJ0338358.1 hypothetical protein [Cryobacterium sp. PH31-O1]